MEDRQRVDLERICALPDRVYNSSVLGQIWVSGAHGHDNLVDSLVVRHLAAVDSSSKERRVIVLVGDSDIHATPTGDRYGVVSIFCICKQDLSQFF